PTSVAFSVESRTSIRAAVCMGQAIRPLAELSREGLRVRRRFILSRPPRRSNGWLDRIRETDVIDLPEVGRLPQGTEGGFRDRGPVQDAADGGTARPDLPQ